MHRCSQEALVSMSERLRIEMYYANVTVHVLAAMLWLGGMLFLGLVGAPVLRGVDPPDVRQQLFHHLGLRFRTIGWCAIAVLLLTGAANLYFRGWLSHRVLLEAGFWTMPPGRALALKLVAVAAMLVASGVHDFLLGPRAGREPVGSPGALRLRRRAALLARINAFLGVIVVVGAVRLARGG